MAVQSNELKKLIAIASDLEISVKLRTQALEVIGKIGTHDALLALLEIAANEKLISKERDLALQNAREIVKAGR